MLARSPIPFLFLPPPSPSGCSVVGVRPFANVVTQLQMFQFLTMMSQAIYILAFKCAYPARVTIFYLFYILSLYVLFYLFSLEKYGGAGDKKAKSAKKN